MMKGLAIAILAFSWLNVLSQQRTPLYLQLSGKITDSVGVALARATVLLTSGLDTLTTLSRDDGSFVFPRAPAGTIQLFITMKGYLSFNRTYSVEVDKGSLNLPPINLRTSYGELNPVTVTGVRPVTFQGDTVSYNVVAFPVCDGSEVQDILKRLPGIEVDADGNVIVQGKKIEKVMVDGKEFFGGDVLLAIQNLPADIVDKLQVIDDYGDKARLTGVRSGDAAKVLNIVLRADKHNGQFGQLNAAAGDQGKFAGSAFANDLRGERQMGVHAGASNNSPAGNDPAQNGGVNYANQWGLRWGLASSISTSGQSPQSIVSTTINNFYPGELLQQIQDNHNDANSRQSSVSSRLTYKPDPYTTVRLTNSGNMQSSDNRVAGDFSTLEQDSGYSKSTNGTSDNQARSAGHSFASNLFYERTEPNNRRRFSIEADFRYSATSGSNNYQSSATVLIDGGASNSFLHDMTTNDTRGWNVSLNVNYFLPASSGAFVELGYGANTSISQTSLLTQEADSAGILPTPVDSLSQSSILNALAQRAHAGYTAKISQLDFTVGLDAQPGEIKGTDDAKGDLITYAYFSLLPSLQAAWTFDKKRQLRFGYSGQSSLPSLQQLSPLTNFSNPQYPVTGNPDLRQSYTHRISVNYEHSDLKATQFFGYGLGVNYSTTIHSILSNLITPKDSGQVIQSTTYLNAGTTSNLGINYHLTLPSLFHRKFKVMLAGGVSRNSTITVTNDVQYPTQSWTVAPSAHLQLLIPDLIETDLSASYGMTRAVYSGNANLPNTFRSAFLNLTGRHYFFHKWIINYQFMQSYTATTARLLTLPPILTASLQRKFLPHNLATVKLSGYNLFNQSVAVGQSFSPTTITQTAPQLTGRYFLLTFQLKLQRFRK